MKTIEIRDVNGNLRELIARMAAGDEVILADCSKPVARLTPILSSSPAVPGEKNEGPRVSNLSRGKIAIAPDFDSPLPEDFWFGAK